MKNIIQCVVLVVLIAVLASCGGGGGGDASGGDLTASVGLPLSDYVVVDLRNGSVTSYSSLNDIVSNDDYKTTHMVFRTIGSNSTRFGSNAADLGHQADEIEGTASESKYFIGVFEVTQEQWRQISGDQPWTTIDSSALGLPSWTVVDDKSPACLLNYTDVVSSLSSFSSGEDYSLVLPSDLQWELACRSDSNAVELFSWGDVTSTVLSAQYAVTRETTGGVSGPQEVASHLPNAYGLYDMHGNIWELTSEKSLRGGSWFDNLLQARSANSHAILEDVEHNLVGARLVFKP
ncbi:MAG: SUMF1/EgtB/PvdO family nonheme iron enzyme [Planctomycetes bacterium]|nr:SUMF1/EgtB/PvdO family nonheme iron enzyme [Planctomycetota bacterium]